MKKSTWKPNPTWVVEMKIDHLKKAIENIGKPRQQTLYVSSCGSMDESLGGGNYIDLNESPLAHKAIKRVLVKMLEEQENILKTLV